MGFFFLLILRNGFDLFLFLMFSAPQFGSFKLLDRPTTFVNVSSQRRCAVKPLNAEPKRNGSVVPLAATIAAPGGFLFFFYPGARKLTC
jgi:adenylyl-sulfate reductase (glutathione)